MKDAPQDLQNHPLFNRLDYVDLRTTGYTDAEIKATLDAALDKPQALDNKKRAARQAQFHAEKAQKHDDLIASIRAKLDAITTLIDREAQAVAYDWSDIGDLGYIDERLQEIIDFRNNL